MQSHVSGGTDPNTPPVPTTQGHELRPDGDGWIELDDNGVPLGRWVWSDIEEKWVFERFPPPASGRFPFIDRDNPWLIFILSALVLIGIGALIWYIIVSKKRRKK